jgi:predicted N-formylglutamate amidohydrolase
MTENTAASLLRPTEPPAVEVVGSGSAAALLIVCDHASRRLPQALDTLGLSRHDTERHIAYDIGAREVALGIGARLGASVILQNYSRLVIDCNRPPGSPESIVTASDHTVIPGNVGLSEADALVRRQTLFDPYHRRIAEELDRRQQRHQPLLLLAMHSFTPRFAGHDRPWHLGTLALEDRRAANSLLKILRRDLDLTVGDNEPYAMSVDSDYTLSVHGEARGLLYVGLEVRQDLINGSQGQETWSTRLAAAFDELCRVLPL